MNPTVTIIMATYNRAHFIAETLESIRNQTYSNWECIIIDDYSTDNTCEIIEAFIKKDPRFFYFLKTDKYKKGLSGSRNYGLDKASLRYSSFIQLFDDDDIMHPKKIELQILPLLKYDFIDFSLCKYRHYYGNEILNFELEDIDCNLKSENLFEDFYFGKIAMNSLNPLWRGEILKKYRFDEEILYGEEKELYLRLILKENPKFIAVDYVLFYYRKHRESNTGSRYNKNLIVNYLYKSDLKLLHFVKTNELWNGFLIKEFSKKFIFNNYDREISLELLDVLKKNKKFSQVKYKIIVLILNFMIFTRKQLIKIINKI